MVKRLCLAIFCRGEGVGRGEGLDIYLNQFVTAYRHLCNKAIPDLPTLFALVFKDCLPHLFHGLRNNRFNKIW